MFKPPPYDPDRPNKQTDAQKAATQRNFGIFGLRGLHANCGMLREPYRSTVRALIDADLVSRGAESETARQNQRRAKTAAYFADLSNESDEVPF